jgi:hypothetical protein
MKPVDWIVKISRQQAGSHPIFLVSVQPRSGEATPALVLEGVTSRLGELVARLGATGVLLPVGNEPELLGEEAPLFASEVPRLAARYLRGRTYKGPLCLVVRSRTAEVVRHAVEQWKRRQAAKPSPGSPLGIAG